MPQVTLNYWAILVAAVAQMVIGALWYGPLFGKMWMHLTHRTMDDMKGQSAGSAYAMGFVVALVSAYVLAHFVDYVKAATIGEAVQLAFWVWLGFVATVTASMVLWEGKPVKLWVLHNAHHLIALSVSAAILVRWV